MATDSSGYRERNSTADRALVILGLFTEDRLQISANDVAEALGSARSTAYRYLQTLVAASFLEEAPGGGFRLGIGVLELARLARRGYGLTAIAQPVMRALADEVGETVLLTRLVDDTVVCIERCEGAKQLVRLSYERGSRLPINAGASALTLLAWLPEKEIRELLGRHGLQRFTERTLTDVDVLVQRLAERRLRHDRCRGRSGRNRNRGPDFRRQRRGCRRAEHRRHSQAGAGGSVRTAGHRCSDRCRNSVSEVSGREIMIPRSPI